MKKINATIIAVVAASLILVAGCYDNGTPMPPVAGYDGLMSAGWTAFEAGDYADAMDKFQAALDMDTSRPEAYLGSGWCSVVLADYWGVGYDYDYMAVQHDGGEWPVEIFRETAVQDTNWTVFECISPELTANDRLVIESFGESLLVVDGDTLIPGFYRGFSTTDTLRITNNWIIGKWLEDVYGHRVRFQYRYQINRADVSVVFRYINAVTQRNCDVDSIVNGSASTAVYLSAPPEEVKGGDPGWMWISCNNPLEFSYSVYGNPGGQTDITADGLVAYGCLQDVRGLNGKALEGVTMLLGLAADHPQYSFSHYKSLTSINLKGMAAAIALRNRYFRPALYICQQAGYGLNIKIADPNFLVALVQVIEDMLK